VPAEEKNEKKKKKGEQDVLSKERLLLVMWSEMRSLLRDRAEDEFLVTKSQRTVSYKEPENDFVVKMMTDTCLDNLMISAIRDVLRGARL